MLSCENVTFSKICCAHVGGMWNGIYLVADIIQVLPQHTCLYNVYIIYKELHSEFTLLQPPSQTMLLCENVTFSKHVVHMQVACGMAFTLWHIKYMWVPQHTCIREVEIIYQEIHSEFTLLQPPSRTMLSCENLTFSKICGAHVGGMWNGIYLVADIIQVLPQHTCLYNVYIIYKELHSEFTLLQPPSQTMLLCENVTFSNNVVHVQVACGMAFTLWHIKYMWVPKHSRIREVQIIYQELHFFSHFYNLPLELCCRVKM